MFNVSSHREHRFSSRAVALGAAALLATAGSTRAQSYRATELVNNICCELPNTDPNLVEAWGVAMGKAGAAWVTVPRDGKATLYNGAGNPQALVVRMTIPGDGDASLPTGIAANGSPDFVVSNNAGGNGPARFLFATHRGTITGWTPIAPPAAQNTRAAVAVDRIANGASYMGVGVASTAGGNRLYAADFHNRRIDTFDGAFAPVAAAFTDANLPAGFAPFNVRVLAGRVYVAYALPDGEGAASRGAGLGVVDVYDVDGGFIRRLVTGGRLNAPWGMAIAPANFGALSGALLVANTGDGKINAWDPLTGAPLGPVLDGAGTALVIDGLRGIEFGNGVLNQPTNALFFAASPGFGVVGIYGRLDQACPADFDGDGLIEPADVAMFVGNWFASIQQATLSGDLDGDGSVAPADIARFVSLWLAASANGC